MGTMNLRLIGILLKEESLKIPIIYNQICSFERFDERIQSTRSGIMEIICTR